MYICLEGRWIDWQRYWRRIQTHLRGVLIASPTRLLLTLAGDGRERPGSSRHGRVLPILCSVQSRHVSAWYQLAPLKQALVKAGWLRVLSGQYFPHFFLFHFITIFSDGEMGERVLLPVPINRICVLASGCHFMLTVSEKGKFWLQAVFVFLVGAVPTFEHLN